MTHSFGIQTNTEQWAPESASTSLTRLLIFVGFRRRLGLTFFHKNQIKDWYTELEVVSPHSSHCGIDHRGCATMNMENPINKGSMMALQPVPVRILTSWISGEITFVTRKGTKRLVICADSGKNSWIFAPRAIDPRKKKYNKRLTKNFPMTSVTYRSFQSFTGKIKA